MNPLRSIDNLDDRREVWRLLARLGPMARYGFLGWACNEVPKPDGFKPRPSWDRMRARVEASVRRDPAADLTLTNEIYTDLVHLVLQYGLDPVATVVELELLVRRSPWIPIALPLSLTATAAWPARTPCTAG